MLNAVSFAQEGGGLATNYIVFTQGSITNNVFSVSPDS